MDTLNTRSQTSPLHQQACAVTCQKIKQLVTLYLKHLEERPLLTKAVTSALLAGAGDLLSQWISQLGKPVRKQYSFRSTAAFAAFSMVVTGPCTHYFYQLLEVVVPKKSKLSSVRKVVIDRLLFAPPYLLALFYTVAILEGKSSSQAWLKVKQVFWSALIRNWVVWGIAQYINMTYVPVKYRVLFANMVSLLWNIYLAFIRR